MSERTCIRDYPMTMVMHLSREDGGELQHRCEEIGLTRVVWTPKKRGVYGKGEVSWFIDGSKEQYAVLGDAVDAMRTVKSKYWNERKKFVALYDAEKKSRVDD